LKPLGRKAAIVCVGGAGGRQIKVSILARAEARALLRLERELVALRANAWAAGKVREAVRA